MVAVVGAPVRRGGAGPVLDQHVLTVLPRIPGPAEIADTVAVGPGQEGVVKADGGAHVVSGLPDEHGDLQRDRPDDGVPAGPAGAALLGIAVPPGDELPRRVMGLVRQPP